MPSKPNFHASLPLPDPRRATRDGAKPGPDAGGLIEEGDELMWVYVWIIQNGDDMTGGTWAAAADGESPDGKTFTGEWEVETEMTYGSDAFRPEIAAIGTAMALINRANGSTDVYWWTDAVTFEPQTEAAT